MGLGLLGRGVGDAEFLARMGARVLVTDLKSREELRASVEYLEQYPNISFRLGGHDRGDFTHADIVIKAAGVPLNSPEIEAARAAGVPVYMSSALAAQFARAIGARLIGVTGTRGKSTIAHLVYHALKLAGRRVHLGGNVRGVSTLALLIDIQKGDTLVLELDSWQLQGFGDLTLSPHIAVFSNLMPDHQNYYASMEEYFNDKALIFKYQNEGDVLVVGSSVVDKVRAAHPVIEPSLVPPLPEDWTLLIQGEHNRENAALAATALRAAGLAEDAVRRGLETFRGVEGRLQLVREMNGVKIYNDNNATTPEATIVALRALTHDSKKIILVMGGSDKGLDMSALLYEIAQTCKRVILLSGSGTARLTPFMNDYSVYDALESAVHEAVQGAVSGDIILFSPAFASFGMFKNEYERNDQFLSIIRAL